uniref:Myomesin 3 n=1 Tax=Labrus bergylta TaxID=56723 RepID=A0A3Q3EVU2_9LABR
IKGKRYCFRVRSINKYGVSDPSEPTQPISLAVPAPPHSVLAFRDTDTSVLLQWQEPKAKDDILGYYLYYSETGKKEWQTVNNKPISQNRFTVHGLKTRREYVFMVKAVSRAGNSNYSDESQPILVKSAIHVPSAPSAITLLLCTGSEMVLGWRAPASNGGDPVRGYYLDQRDKGMKTWREVNVKPAKERQYKVCNLTSGRFYQFRVLAGNMAGVGKPSEASEEFLCEKWTMPEPACPYDVEVREVRNDSLVLLWAAPLYEGRSPVTGYLLEMSQGDQSDDWTAVTEKPISDTHYKVSGLQAGQTYRLRVSAVNEAGVSCASLPTEPVTAETRPGTKNIEVGVDDDGFIFLGYEADEMNDESKFLWGKNYTEPLTLEEFGQKPRRIGGEVHENNSDSYPSEEDLGLYTVEMSDNPNLSSSYDFTAEDLERLKELSWEVRNPLIALKSGWQVEVSEKGDVRLWLQTESLSDNAELRLIFNDQEISSTPRRKINFDKSKGLVEILFDRLSTEDQGSYTAQLRDGRAKNQFTLVFVDQSKPFTQPLKAIKINNRTNEVSQKVGHFYLRCVISPHTQVTNTNKDTTLKWFKESAALTQVVYDHASGVCTLSVPQVTKKEAGSYRAVVSDGRGEDVSTLELLHDARMKTGSSMDKVWIEICNPTENDKGKYTLEMFDGEQTHKRYLDLSAQGGLDLKNLKCQIKDDFKNRAKVTKGLPDVVAIMEGKSLCLTCFIDGAPSPEISWLRNDKEIVDETQFTITKEPKCSTITIHNVNMADSGKYSIFVRNKCGSETVDVTVSVYKLGDKPPANAVDMGYN